MVYRIDSVEVLIKYTEDFVSGGRRRTINFVRELPDNGEPLVVAALGVWQQVLDAQREEINRTAATQESVLY